MLAFSRCLTGSSFAPRKRVRDLKGNVVWSCINPLKPDMSGPAVGFDTSAAEGSLALPGGTG
jgi:hypothetical protein